MVQQGRAHTTYQWSEVFDNCILGVCASMVVGECRTDQMQGVQASPLVCHLCCSPSCQEPPHHSPGQMQSSDACNKAQNAQSEANVSIKCFNLAVISG